MHLNLTIKGISSVFDEVKLAVKAIDQSDHVTSVISIIVCKVN